MSEMIKAVTCDVCRDLAPLVQDGVASADSTALVHAHLETCEACRALFPELAGAGESDPQQAVPDDERVFHRIRRKVNRLLWVLILAALAFGVGIDRYVMHYLVPPSGNVEGYSNVLLFMLLCGASYWLHFKLWKFVPWLAGLETFAWTLWYNRNGRLTVILQGLLRACPAVLLCYASALAAALLYYAVKGEKRK